MKFVFTLVLAAILYSCSNNGTDNNNKTGTDSLTNKKKLLELTNDSVTKPPFWIIALNATSSADSASSMVEKLMADGKKAGYLWIPDYSTLSGKKMYCVFLGPFYSEYDAAETLMPYKKENPGAYAVKCDHEGSRFAMYGPFDIRRDDKKMNMVIIYSTPEDEESYANEGGEDWGWFVSDVGQYVNKELPDVYYGVSMYRSWFSNEEIKALEKELKPEGFGYILIKGNEKTFVSHNTPDAIINSICEFFGYEFNENWNNE